MNVSLSKMYVDDQIQKVVLNVLNSGRYINGQNLKSFEEEFADLCSSKYAVGVNSGTSAILLSLMALGIGEGDEVIVPSHTFIATASPAKFLGATLVYADIDPEIYTIDPADVQGKITPRTKAIIPVHLYGHPCDMDPINELARANNIYIIEDACQAHSATYKGKRTGSLGDIACFSFFPSKNMTRVKQRDNLASYLKGKGIETGIHYPVPVHRQPYLMSDVHLPITEKYVDEILSLPMHPQLSDEQVDYVASEVRNFMGDAGCRE